MIWQKQRRRSRISGSTQSAATMRAWLCVLIGSANSNELTKSLGFRCVRFHGLLSDDIGTVVREKNRLFYSFFNADQIFDFLLSIGMKPFVELSFMPDALASGAKTVFGYEANVTPPKDYKQWAGLIERLVSHCVERYGEKEVGEWLFEVWNEPNLKTFWTGTQREYFKLYRHTAEAIKTCPRRSRWEGRRQRRVSG